MNRQQLHHVIRAAGAVLNVDGLLVNGYQAVHGSARVPPIPGDYSMEADIALPGVAPDEAEAAADLIDGAIGEESLFHETHGYYAQGVTERTAKLPDGWRDRVIADKAEDTNGVTAYYLEAHDLWVSKAVAGREKDAEFCREMATAGLVETQVLLDRLESTPDLAPEVTDRVRGWIDREAMMDRSAGVGQANIEAIAPAFDHDGLSAPLANDPSRKGRRRHSTRRSGPLDP